MHLRRIAVARRRDEVLRARRLLLGLLPLRHRPRLRRHRLDQPGRILGDVDRARRPGVARRRSRRAAAAAARRLRACSSSGFGFKVAAVPFHVVDARRLPGLAHAGGRVHGVGREGGRLRRAAPGLRRRPSARYSADWQPFVFALAVLTLLVGSVLAVVQTDVKRMLAYSSISHAGFILRRASRRPPTGASPARSSTCWPTRSWSPGSFGVVTVVGRHGRRPPPPRRLPGPGPPARRCWPSRSPCSCWPRPVCRSPSGFFAKFYVLGAAVDAERYVAGPHRHGLGGDRRLPVPADHRGHVHGRRGRTTAGAGADRRPVPFGAALALGVARWRHPASSASCPGLLDDVDRRRRPRACTRPSSD